MQIESDTLTADDADRESRWTKWGARIAAGAFAAIYLLMIVQVGAAHADGLNPFTDIKPDPGLFGNAFNSVWKRLLGAAWGLCLIFLAIQAVMALAKRSRAARQGASADLAESTEEFRDALVRFALASGISVVIGAVLFAVNA